MSDVVDKSAKKSPGRGIHVILTLRPEEVAILDAHRGRLARATFAADVLLKELRDRPAASE